MTAATRLGQALRRLASVSSIRSVRHADDDRVRRHGATAAELNERFALHVAEVEARVEDP